MILITSRCVGQSYRRDFWNQQPVRVEVWSEKGTVRGVLAPVLDEYGVGFRVMHGFSGATTIYDVAQADNARPFIVLKWATQDPSGMCMSEEDLPEATTQIWRLPHNSKADCSDEEKELGRPAIVPGNGQGEKDPATNGSDPKHPETVVGNLMRWTQTICAAVKEGNVGPDRAESVGPLCCRESG